MPEQIFQQIQTQENILPFEKSKFTEVFFQNDTHPSQKIRFIVTIQTGKLKTIALTKRNTQQHIFSICFTPTYNLKWLPEIGLKKEST